ncbi:hypothetical protein RUM43_005428 [Polyplax serrata]|uniref:acylaminoacyl-peptidase n=1 Tax=Polyplax serrata TaxID=468196 RepID=A0AAN8S4R7_POLSC
MSNKVDFINNCVKTYRSLVQYPTVLSGEISSGGVGDDIIKILSQWSQRNIEKGEVTKFQKNHLLKLSSGEIIHESIPSDCTQESLSMFSPTRKLRCVVKEIEHESKTKTYIEIWNHKGLFKNFDISAFDVHGDIYTDGEFGSLEWSQNEEKVIYIAEKKAKKTEPFYKQKSADASKDQNKDILLGDEYLYKPDWGEQLVDKHQPIIGICDITSETLKVLDGIPKNFSPGQVLWAKDGSGIFGVVFENEPRRLGIIYCTNRVAYIFHLNFKGEFKILSDKEKSVRCPRLSPDGKNLFWLQRPVGGAHNGCRELIKFNLETNKKEVLIDIVKQGNKTFSGLYMHNLPPKCFSKDGKKLFFSTLHKMRICSFYLDLETKNIHQIDTGDGSSMILDVNEDMILISSGSFMRPPCLKLSKSITQIEWIPVTIPECVCPGSTIKEMEFESVHYSKEFAYYNALYFGPTSAPSDKKVPLIVYPHGGPHSAAFNDFSLEFSFFVTLGYGILAVNYRGSTGVGQDGVDFLRGKLGDSDVKDMQEAVLQTLDSFPHLDSKNIYLYGKSYGGYLVGQLSANFPDFYRAVANFNGVSDVCSMYTMSDIPDWASVENGFEFDESKILSMEEASRMIEVSPVQLANKIKAPTLFLVGKKDLRVPFYQGLRMYNALKSRNVKVRLNLYDSNHTLGGVPVHIDSVINSAVWFLENKA